MSRQRELIEDQLFTQQLKELGNSLDLDDALDAAAWALSTRAERYRIIPGTTKLRVIKTEPHERGEVCIPSLKIWFTIENDDQVLLRGITLESTTDETDF